MLMHVGYLSFAIFLPSGTPNVDSHYLIWYTLITAVTLGIKCYIMHPKNSAVNSAGINFSVSALAVYISYIVI